MSEFFPVSIIRKSDRPYLFPNNPKKSFNNILIKSKKDTLSFEGYLKKLHIAGFIVVQKGAVVYEKYFSMLPDDKHTLQLVTAKKSSLAHKSTISLNEVAELPLALPFSGYSTIRFFEESFSQKNLNPNICMEINDIPTLFEIVKTGHWHTILSDTSLNDPDVVGIPIEGANMKRTIMIISLKEAYEKKAVKKLYELLSEV